MASSVVSLTSIGLLVNGIMADYTKYPSQTAYEYGDHGAKDIDSDDTAPVDMSVDDCKARCDDDSVCECVAYRLSDRKCWKRADCVPAKFGTDDEYDTYVKEAGPTPPPPPTSWKKYQNMNCYNGHGATAVDAGDIGKLSLADCEDACARESTCKGVVMEATCDATEKVKCWRYSDLNLPQCEESSGHNLWLKTSNHTTPNPRPEATCTPCPALQTFDDDSHRQNCPDQERFQWIKDLIAKGCNQVWHLEAKTYYVDRQYLLPCGVTVKGAGKGQTIIKAVRCEAVPQDYGIGTEGAKYRIGLVVNTNTQITDLSFEGADEYRYAKHGASGKDYTSEGYGDGPGALCKAGGNNLQDLQGGGAFETPGCPDPYACGLTPCINGQFSTPVGYKWEPVSSIAVRNVLIRDVETNNVQNGFFGAPLFPEHLSVGDDFDVDVHKPSNISIINFHSKMTHADGINLHGNFEDVLIDSYIADEAYDDCIALWSYRETLGNFTVRNSQANHCGYQGCYVAYGGTGPYTFSDNDCSTQTGGGKCLWLDGDMFNGQFTCDSQVTSTGATCSGKSSGQECVQRGTPKNFCPSEEASIEVV